ncbi:MAG: hypothetical protein WA092_00775 [Minisyncoccales bacterium]|jgi:multisubunit Na+/H+ antiporter MnhB subunit
MKNSTILIVVGIIIMVVGGIVLMNSFAETQKKTANADHPLNKLIEKQKQMMKIDEPKTNPFVSPFIIIMFGAALIVVGFFTGQPRHSKNLPPGIG